MAVTRPAATPVTSPLPRANYDAETDTLFFRISDRPAVARHLDEEMWLLVDAENEHTLGIFVEDFERVFLKRHPELALAWKNAHPPVLQRMSRSMKDGFVRVFLNWLKLENRDVGLALCAT